MGKRTVVVKCCRWFGGIPSNIAPVLLNSFASGRVIGVRGSIGGLVGWQQGGNIANSSASGDVNNFVGNCRWFCRWFGGIPRT